MRRNSTSAVGALHPILFFAIVYAISLFLAFFVCSTIYYTFHKEANEAETLAQHIELETTTNATAYR